MIKKIIINTVPGAEDIIKYELQNGFYIQTESGINLSLFLTQSCRISENYIQDKIKTVFHNGNPVDNLQNVKLRDNSVVAVSGAMPGLVGAMMRIGSPYAIMRESITEKDNSIPETGKIIYVKLKLFNTILHDLGKNFIAKGVIMDKESIVHIIKKCEFENGKSFSFKCNNKTADSCALAMLTDEKFIITSFE